MKSKTFVALAVAGLFSSAGAFADQPAPYSLDNMSPANVSEVPAAMTTVTSLDTRTGGYKGWGPMANPMVAASVSESAPMAMIDQEREQLRQIAEVKQAREQVWVANAPLRAEYENIGATRNRAGGFGGFFSRDSK